MGRQGQRGLWVVIGVAAVAALALMTFHPARSPQPTADTTPAAAESATGVESAAAEVAAASNAVGEPAHESIGGNVEETVGALMEKTVGESGGVSGIDAENIRRETIARALPPYAEKESALKTALKAELGAIGPERVPEIVAKAGELEAEFWGKGDFDDITAFDSIYRARAMLELALDAAPTDEATLKKLIGVIDAGWPMLLGPVQIMKYGASGNEADQALLERCIEGRDALRKPMETLWLEHLSKRKDMSFEDLTYAAGHLFLGPSADEYEAVINGLRAVDPNVSRERLRDATMEHYKRKTLPVVDCMIEACRAKGGAWAVYEQALQQSHDEIEGGALSNIGDVWDESSLSSAEVSRYWGRLPGWAGPPPMRAKLRPLHETSGN